MLYLKSHDIPRGLAHLETRSIATLQLVTLHCEQQLMRTVFIIAVWRHRSHASTVFVPNLAKPDPSAPAARGPVPTYTWSVPAENILTSEAQENATETVNTLCSLATQFAIRHSIWTSTLLCVGEEKDTLRMLSSPMISGNFREVCPLH